ncbi:TetR/AcrR family transcriptional regulator [Thermomonospora umbrina]|uniref:TetR family transcriptional regulator n=1 Tax=Thermomonospora umbrina TaxID=111806 RepID=A0A3D9SMD9_9ACTN|nr:TetR/AcrR family transcriptional regulator [Thermomonospora umbrina]REE96897.1 TetR family transcriptional regulator [Thermomonospora umbrina]
MTGRERILEAALRCFGRDGVAATPLGRLLAESKVSAGSFYHHFSGKEEVAATLYTETLGRYQQGFLRELRLHGEPRAAVVASVAFHIAWCGANRDRARFLFTERPPGAGRHGGEEFVAQNRAFFEEVRSWWRLHEHHGALLPLDFTTAHVLWLGPAQELCRLWLTERVPEPSEEQIATLGEAAWRCLRTPNPEKGVRP